MNKVRDLGIWDGFTILLVVFLIEILNYKIYHHTNRTFSISLSSLLFKKSIYSPKHFFKIEQFFFSKKTQNNFLDIFIVIKILNYFKIGFMLGFFIDAFKVGS